MARFLHAVLRQLVPEALWGGAKNRATFFAHVKRFVRLGRFESFSLNEGVCVLLRLRGLVLDLVRQLEHHERLVACEGGLGDILPGRSVPRV